MGIISLSKKPSTQTFNFQHFFILLSILTKSAKKSAKLVAEGVYYISNVPEKIDIEATVEAFTTQILALDFSQPILVPKQVP
jgi:hypothetical protein